MKNIDGLIFFVVIGVTGAVILMDLYFLNWNPVNEGRKYRVSINRIEKAITAFEEKKRKPPAHLEELEQFMEVEEYPSITGLYSIGVNDSTKKDLADFLQEGSEDYVVIVTEDNYYKVAYHPNDVSKRQVLTGLNGMAFLMLVILLAVLVYVRQEILLPFYKFSDIPYQLSKGNLTIPLQENRNKFFGKFIWGMDLLRENLEENKTKELEMQKEKKVLLLSLSHDIKTPLSAIKLYARALSRNLYREEEKKQEIAENINAKVDEIEGYISEIVRASHEDFLHFEVDNREFYVSEVLENIREYYEDKMALNQIAFEIERYRTCLLSGDKDRLEEVLQNVIENAIKYGDGRQIRIETEREEDAYIIRVLNTGCTLQRKELPHIFESFFRGSNVEKRQGSGLGLYICRQLMHLMEGEITAVLLKEGEETMMSVNIMVQIV